MIISSLPFKQFKDRVSSSGISFRVGPFSVNVRSSIDTVISGIYLLYSNYHILDDDFIDFWIHLQQPKNLRRWYRPQVVFNLDGFQPFKPLPLSQAFAFFEWGLNWAVAKHANRYLLLHSAVLEKNNRALILPAPPGSGKSTLCAALSLSGWRLLTDEMALTQLSDGMIRPLARPVSLKNESINIIRAFSKEAVIGNIAKDTTKGDVAHLKADKQAVSDQSCPAPQWLVSPVYTPEAKAVLEPMDKAEMFMHTVNNCFNYNVLGPDAFHATTRLVEQCDCYHFSYSQLDDAIGLFDKLAFES